MRIAVLAVQGAFIEHREMLSRLNVSSIEIRQRKDLDYYFDGLIIPGGESTVQSKLIKELGLYDTLREYIISDLPVFGTCAGLLLLAKEIKNDNRVHLATMNISAVRNAYGRQLGSFYTEGYFYGIGRIPMTFIRAPYIAQVNENAKALAVVDNHIVAALQDNQLVTSFHPELNNDLSVHKFFINMILNKT